MDEQALLEVLRRPISSLDQEPAKAAPSRLSLPVVPRWIASLARSSLPLPRRRPTPWVPSGTADVLVIVPPFGSLYVPSLAAHTLQALAREAGYSVDVLYANFLLAGTIGDRKYNEVAWEPIGPFVAERLFSRWAFGLPPLGHHAEQMFELPRMFGEKQAKVYGCMPETYVAYSQGQRRTVRRLRLLEARIGAWLDQVAGAVAGGPYRIVGCTSTFEQTVCSVALLDRIKRLRGDIVTIIGGANCDGEMSEGIASLGMGIDYIFSGESDGTFPAFVGEVLSGRRPEGRIIRGQPCEDMDALPTPRFDDFFEQRQRHLPASRRPNEMTLLSYETSRGCWWGQKQHCTFCGLNGEGMASRRKSADRVIEELRTLTGDYPTRNIGMTDNIMPHEYFKTLLPRLSAELPGLAMFYEQKANLALWQVLALKEAGITTIQPGIEALSSPMLQLMKKGVQAWQNLLLLRYARIAGVRLWWSVLCGFPGDQEEFYRETLRIARLTHHLPPPVALWHLIIDRFSPYFMRPGEFGVRDISPYPAYADFLPVHADIPKLAYHFVAEYDSAAEHIPDVIRDLGRELYQWRTAWQRPYGDRPELKIERHRGSYVLIDTAGCLGRIGCAASTVRRRRCC